jgi:hypothetical protein
VGVIVVVVKKTQLLEFGRKSWPPHHLFKMNDIRSMKIDIIMEIWGSGWKQEAVGIRHRSRVEGFIHTVSQVMTGLLMPYEQRK